MKLLTIVGARPQFIKAAAVSKAIARAQHDHPDLESVLVHTGQHYDFSMSKVFFEQLGLPTPDVNLAVGSGGHGTQTGRMLEKIEETLLEHRPDVVIVYGDTNSTLAGALAAAKLHMPIAHVEAGLRSFNRRMPEEINRVLTDHVSRWLFCPTSIACDNLRAEGVTNGVDLVGDVMYELTMMATRDVEVPAKLRQAGLPSRSYALATIHRAENTDDAARLRAILGAISTLSEEVPVVLPMHPRTASTMERLGVTLGERVLTIAPLGYLEMAAAEAHARLILTDSGGVQKEAYWLGVPCVTVRDETEWVETLEEGRNILAGGTCERRITDACIRQRSPVFSGVPLVSRDRAASTIVEQLLSAVR